MIKLYQFPISHYCEKIRWALDFKGLDYETVNLLPGFHAKTVKKLTQYSSVPILSDDNVVIQNSSEIISYLDKHYPDKSLTPAHSENKKKALEWEKYVDTELGVHLRLCVYNILLDYPEIVTSFFAHNGPWYGKPLMKLIFPKLKIKMRLLMNINEAAAIHSKEKMHQAVDKIFAHLQQQPYLAGEHFSRADLAAAALLAPLRMPVKYGLDWPKENPVALQEFINEFDKKTSWVDNVYEKFR